MNENLNVHVSLDEEKRINDLLDQGIDELIRLNNFSLNKTEKTFTNILTDSYVKNKHQERSEKKFEKGKKLKI